SFDDVLGAMAVRIQMARKRRNLSYVDAIGYYVARKRRLQFLTRDPGFRGLPGVLVPRKGEWRQSVHDGKHEPCRREPKDTTHWTIPTRQALGEALRRFESKVRDLGADAPLAA